MKKRNKIYCIPNENIPFKLQPSFFKGNTLS
jgi:hypothetical protein